MKLSALFIAFSIGVFTASLPAQNIKTDAFIENKGQIIDQNGNTNDDVMYLLTLGEMNVQFKANGFCYDRFKKISETEIRPKNENADKTHSAPTMATFQFNRIDAVFENTNPDCRITAFGGSEQYSNYYMSQLNEPVLNVKKYSGIKYNNLYPNIDVEFYMSAENKFKYQFIIKPGGNINDIHISFNGVDSCRMRNDDLVLYFGQDSLIETIPLSYSLNSGNTQLITFRNLGKNIFGFGASGPLDSETLIIDPQPSVNWSSYHGDANRDRVESVLLRNGFTYSVGSTYSIANIATSGAYQSTYNAAGDCYLAKWNSNGAIIWSTYYGGSVYDGLMSIDTDGNNLFVTGYTNSSSGMSTPGSHQSTYGGGVFKFDVLFASFDTTGMRIWSSYYGGVNDDVGLSLICRGPFFYISGTAESATLFATAGAHQASYSGAEDVFVAKFTTNGVRVWGTYYGGQGTENGGYLDCAGNRLLVGGRSFSTTNIATAGTHQSSIANIQDADAFIALFDTNGVRQWGSYFGGNFSESGIPLIMNGEIYLTGHTYSYTNIASFGAHQTSIGGGADNFLAKFNSTGQRIWSTYYGGNADDEPYAISEYNNKILLGGKTLSTINFATSGAYQTVFGGVGDGYLALFDTSGNPLWTTYYGGNDDDFITSISVDEAYFSVGGFCASTNNIATPGAWQTVYGGGTSDGFVASLTDNCALLSMTLTSTPDGGSCNGSANAIVSGNQAPLTYLWSTGGTSASISNMCTGWYSVQISDTNGCQISDSVFINISLGISSNLEMNSVTITPNPASDHLIIHYNTFMGGAAYTLTDITGSIVKSGYLNQDNTVIDTSSLATGLYTVTVTTSKYEQREKVVISR